VNNFPYTECSYCDEGECVPGCGSDDQCPSGYHCTDHLCRGDSGKVPLRSISLQTAVGCTNCTVEGVVVSLLGEKNSLYPDGVPCTTSVLDHLDTVDFAVNYTRVTFDGTLGGEEDEYERNMMGSCYQAPLNGQLSGGTLSWVGNPDDWVAGGVCVDWVSDNFAWWCEVEWSGPDHWTLTACASLSPVVTCHSWRLKIFVIPAVE